MHPESWTPSKWNIGWSKRGVKRWLSDVASSLAYLARTGSPEFKAQVVLEVLSGVETGAEACREYSIDSQLLSKWQAHFLENAARIFDDGSPPHSED